MSNEAISNPLADLLISACSNVFEGDGEVLASGIGLIQRLGASFRSGIHSVFPQYAAIRTIAFLLFCARPIHPDHSRC